MKYRKLWIALLFFGGCQASVRCDPSFHCSGPPVAAPQVDAGLELVPYRGCVGGCVVQHVAAGAEHTCVATRTGEAEGEVVCWGRAEAAQLDGRPSEDDPTPRHAPFGPASSLTASVLHTCAIEGDVSACWGESSAGVIGGFIVDRRFAGFQHLNEDWVPLQISAGAAHTCTLNADRSVHCFGDNHFGQLGVIEDPYLVLRGTWIALSDASDLDAGGTQTCIISLGQVHCWGREAADLEPVEQWVVEGVEAAESVSVGAGHACAIDFGRALFCWGDDTWGQLGRGAPGERASIAAPVSGLGEVYAVDAGGFVPVRASSLTEIEYDEPTPAHTCAATAEGLFCWGANHRGQLGDGTTEDRAAPVRVPIGLVGAVSTGGAHTCALTIEREVYCWGDNAHGQLGVDPVTLPSSAEPVHVPL